MNLTAATPPDMDTTLLPLLSRIADNAARIERLDALSARATTSDATRKQYEAQTHGFRVEIEFAATQAAPYLAEWERRGGWTRAYLAITNGRGHVHAGTSCSTCYPSTRFAVLTDLSGADHDAIVAAIGEDACTVCYPGAPATPRTAFTPEERATREEQAARAAELAEKRAKVAAKQLTNPDGTNLRDTWGSIVKTETGGRNEAVSGLASLLWYGEGHPSAPKWVAFADRVADAIAAKHGTDRDEVRRDLDARAAKKDARDRKAAANA